MNDILKNKFVQSIGVAAIIYLLFQALAWGMEEILSVLESFSRWFRLYAVPKAEEAAIAFGLLYLIISAVTNSKSD